MDTQKSREESKSLRNLSKSLCNLLRHKATSHGLQVRSDGFVRLCDILGLTPSKRFDFSGATLADVQRVVKSCDKQRFKLQQETENETENWWIRANQGHTIKGLDESALLRRITSASEVPVCVHGTYKKVWPLIKAAGLNKMNRNHIHFAVGLPQDQAVISGMRGNANLLIYIDTALAMQDGITFFLSENNVILSSGDDGGTIPPKYFKSVVVRVNNCDKTIFKDGKPFGEPFFEGTDGEEDKTIFKDGDTSCAMTSAMTKAAPSQQKRA